MTNNPDIPGPATSLKELTDRYFVHLTIGAAVMLSAVIDVPAGQPETASLIVVEILETLLLVIFCIGAYEVLRRWTANFWILHSGTVLIANLLTVIADILFDTLVFGQAQMNKVPMDQVSFDVGFLAQEYVSDIKYPAAFWLISTAIASFLKKRQQSATEKLKETVSVSAKGFLRHIPPDWRPEVELIEAQENYIVVYARDQSKTLLYRFKDAVSEMGSEIGLQVHRSYWVRLSRVKDFQKSQGRGTLLMASGRSVPVSRSHMKLLQEKLQNEV